MSLITPDTQITLINSLANLGSANPNDLLLIQRDLRSFRYRYSDLVNNLPDGNSLEVSGNKLKIKDDGIETSMIQDRSISLGKIQNISQNRVLGNVSGSSTSPQQIPITTDLDTTIDNHNELATSKSIKDYLTNKISENVVNKNKKFKINTSQISVGNVSAYTTINEFSFENEFFYAGDVLVIFNMSNRRQWGGRNYRLLFNGDVIAERRYTYIGRAFEIDWTFDIMVPLTIPSDDYYNLLIQYDGFGHDIDVGCAISITDF